MDDIQTSQQHPFLFLAFFWSASRWAAVVKLTWWEFDGGAWLIWFVCALPGSSFPLLPTTVIYAKSLKNYLTLDPVLADTSIKVIPSFLNYSWAELIYTALSSSKSFLFPTIRIKAYSPLTSLTLSIHLAKLLYEFRS